MDHLLNYLDELELKNKVIEQSDEEIKQELIELFNKNLKGKKYIKQSDDHCGAEGHFIEKSLGLMLNGNNEPDYKGYEIKKMSKKITFGDWGATSYLFEQDERLITFNNIPFNITRTDFMRFFGNYNKYKQRFSWAGSCIPKYEQWNDNGTTLIFDTVNNLYRSGTMFRACTSATL